MSPMLKSVASAMATISLLTVPTVAVATTPAPVHQTSPVGSWMMLSMLTSSGAAALGESGVAAAQPDVPPSPPPHEGLATPPLPVILIWLAVIGLDIYLLTKNNHTHPVPNSPG